MSTLIYGLVIAIFLFGKSMAMSDEMQEMAQMLHNTCVAETGVAEDLIIKCRSGDFTDDPKLKCYMLCLLNQISAFDDGEIDVDTLVAMLPEEILGKAEPVLRSCGTIKGTDDCDSVYQTNKCYYDKSPLQMCTF
ncbi:general odorant-binding protein 56d-like isoform X1 [Neodiprion pinetum]|nr:general odorant-binding protein 56d-like isoform X1 [Neodiprion fabricii]XP_046475751.1 general odorant-binding protein 56d-like isoform X1 [Neodiprion pinetum]